MSYHRLEVAMNNFNLIYKEIIEKKIKVIRNKEIIIKAGASVFTSTNLKVFLEKIKCLKKYSFLNLNILFDFGEIEFADKVTYIILDMMFYDLFLSTNFNIRVKMNLNTSAWHYGFKNTALKRSAEPSGRINKAQFLNEYKKKIATNETGNLYRRYIERSTLENDYSYPSKVITEINFVLKQNFNDVEWVNDVCEAIAEVIDNTNSHTDSDCLIDIDICPATNQVDDTDVKILNIVVANFSEERMFDKIKSNITNKAYPNEDDLYRDIYKAYKNHSCYFDKDYNEDDFFHITAFQNGVTSRNCISGNSGTGLTTLIRNIVGKTVDCYSYALSGKNILFFRDGYLNIHEGHIGFNDENDYINFKPSNKVIEKSDVFVPGTIFQLSLVRKREYDEYN